MIGICSSPALNLARSASFSPRVATLSVVAFLLGALLVTFGLVLLWSGRQISRLADVAA